MPTRNETVQAFKNLANLLMSVLTMLLQVSMNDRRRVATGIRRSDSAHGTNVWPTGSTEMFLQNLISQQQSQISAQVSQPGQSSPPAKVKYPGSSNPGGPAKHRP